MSIRGQLLKKLSEKEISFETIDVVSGKLKGFPDNIKEERASQMLAMLNESETEPEFISMIDTLLEISYEAFEKIASAGPVHYIALCYDAVCYDEDLYDCVDLLIAVGDDFYKISTRELETDEADFTFSRCSEHDLEKFPRKILSTRQEPLVFIRREQEEGAMPVLRFHLGDRPILLTADVGDIMIGLSSEGVNGEEVPIGNHILLNDEFEKRE